MSAAGKGAGLSGSRSGLWREYARVVSELRPEWVVVENVASGARRWVDAVVRELGELGYASLPLPVSAADIGAPHRRARIFVVARRVSDTDSSTLRDGAEWRPTGRPGRVRDAGQSELVHVGGWPPGPLDDDGWREWLARGGPAPGAERSVRGGPDGVSARLDRRHRREALMALGNAVVPACAEVAGYVIRELMEAP